MKAWPRCAAGAVTSLFLVLLATPPLAQTPAPSPAATASAAKAPAQTAPTVNPTAPNAPAANPSEPFPAQPAPAEASPPRVESPAARPLLESAPAARAPRDLSPWSMFLNADIVVKAVMVSLAFASLVTWTILFAKSLQLSRARLRLRRALTRIVDTSTLSEAQTALSGGKSALTVMVRAAQHEVRLSGDGASDAGIKERSASRFAEITRAEARAMRSGMAMLATIGATAPFVGLFGTVWGIMNSFIGISKAQTTNLAVVAPGIAEALLATAIGLVAAIPAVIIYNHFSRATKAYLEYDGRGSGAVARLLSRDLDRSRNRLLPRAAE
jgi:biopolymer transport protein ExbB